MLRSITFAVAGLVGGLVLSAGSTFPLGRLLFGVLGLPSYKWTVITFLASLTILWLMLMVWSARVETNSASRKVAPLASGAAAMFTVTLLGLALVNPNIADMVTFVSTVIAGVASVYMLAAWLYLRKAMWVGAARSNGVNHRPVLDGQVWTPAPTPPPLPIRQGNAELHGIHSSIPPPLPLPEDERR